jgi:hypothetical protein
VSMHFDGKHFADSHLTQWEFLIEP